MNTLRRITEIPVPLIVSVAGFSSDDLVEVANMVAEVADAVEIQAVCPNLGERDRGLELQIFDDAASAIAATRRKPVFVRLPAHHNAEDAKQARSIVERAADLGLDGVSVTGSRTVPEPTFRSGTGSISGRPVFDDALRITRDVVRWADGRLSVRSSGGVFDGVDAVRLIQAGADAVEMYTAIIYRGPTVAFDTVRSLSETLDASGCGSLSELPTEAT